LSSGSTVNCSHESTVTIFLNDLNLWLIFRN
jgi:hypothetical protein